MFDGSFSLVGGAGLPTIQAAVDAPPVAVSSAVEKGMRGAGGYGIWSAALLAGLRANAPGAWSSNRLNQANHFIGVAFTAISAMCDGVSSATLEVTDLDAEEEIRSHIHVQKSVSNTARKGVRVPYDHELVELLEDPNPGDTFQDLLYETTLQLCLTGNCLTWMVPNRLGLPSELYVIPTALATPVPYSQAWPRGAWRITPLYPYGPFAVIPTPVATAGAVVPNEDILHIKRKHPLFRWDGYSPLTAGARQMDILDMIDDARWAAFESGINPSIVFEIDAQKAGSNFDQDQLDKFQSKLNDKYSASKNFGKGMILAPGVTAHPYSTAPVDMAFDGGWEQMRDFVLSLFSVPKGLVGITEATSYAALYAALKQFYLIKLKPEADRIAAQWTKFLARRFSRSIRISLPLPALDDPNLLESQLSNDDKIGMRTVDERRAMRGLQPFGDERGEKLVGGGEAGAFGDEPNPLAPDHDNVAGTNSHPKTTATPVHTRRDEADDNRPNNEAGRHSLPGMAGKKSYRKAATTQFNLWGDALTRVQAIGKRIDPADLIELTHLSHITLCYGLECDAAALIDAVRGFGPVTVRLGTVSLFENDGNPVSVASNTAPVQVEPDPCDVLKVDVHSERLHELNRLLRDTFPYNDQYEFNPHITIAKIIPGLGEIYAGSVELSDIELTFTHFLFIDRAGHAAVIPLAAPRLAVQKAVAHPNGHAKMLVPADDLTPPPGTKPRRKAEYPPPNPKPYPPSSSPLPPPSPEGTAAELSSPFWSPTEFEWNLFRQWALALDSNAFPSVHNLAQLGWAKNPALVSAELMGGMGAHHVVSAALEAAIYGLIDLCEANGNAHSVFVTPGPGDDPGPPLVTDQKTYRPRQKTVKDDTGHEHDAGTGQFSTTDTSPKQDEPAEPKTPEPKGEAKVAPLPPDDDYQSRVATRAAARTALDEAEKPFAAIDLPGFNEAGNAVVAANEAFSAAHDARGDAAQATDAVVSAHTTAYDSAIAKLKDAGGDLRKVIRARQQFDAAVGRKVATYRTAADQYLLADKGASDLEAAKPVPLQPELADVPPEPEIVWPDEPSYPDEPDENAFESDAAYNAAAEEYDAAIAKIDADHLAANDKAESEFNAAHSSWASDADKIDAANEAATRQAAAETADAVSKWEATYGKAVEKFNKAESKLDDAYYALSEDLETRGAKVEEAIAASVESAREKLDAEEDADADPNEEPAGRTQTKRVPTPNLLAGGIGNPPRGEPA